MGKSATVFWFSSRESAHNLSEPFVFFTRNEWIFEFVEKRNWSTFIITMCISVNFINIDLVFSGFTTDINYFCFTHSEAILCNVTSKPWLKISRLIAMSHLKSLSARTWKIIFNVKIINTHNGQNGRCTFNTGISYSSHYYYVSRSFARRSRGYGFFN